MNIRSLTVPALIGLSLIFGACAEQKIEAPDNNEIREAIEGMEQGAEDASDAIKSGVKDLQKGAEDATSAASDAVKELEDKIPELHEKQN